MGLSLVKGISPCFLAFSRGGIITPCAHARSGVKQSVLSVCLSSVAQKKLKSRHIDPQKPSKWSQTIANSKKLLCVYLTEVKVLRFAVFRLFPAFHNIGSTSS